MKDEKRNAVGPLAVTRIRVESALSRYPIHRLAKRGDVVIDIRDVNERGETTVRWEVSYNNKYGQPGPLAYKIDTLVVNRRIEEARRPVPKILRLGSLREICRELGLNEGQAVRSVKNALYQNAFAAITAKIRYRQTDGGERGLEIGDTRYGVVFTGEQLPDGRTADAVYLVLHDFYKEILDGAVARPLDYDYLKELSPASQRFYELLSYQMYAALRHGRLRAKLLYSEYCTHAPQTRHTTFDVVKKQMHKVHDPHRKSGYITEIDYHPTTDADGKPDWVMLYQPGPKAKAEFQAFNNKRGDAATPVDVELAPPKSKPLDFQRPLPELLPPELPPLAVELVARGVTAAVAADLARDFSAEAIRLQLEILDGFSRAKRDKIVDPAAYLVVAIRNAHPAPEGFVSNAERQRRLDAERLRRAAEAEELRRRKQAEADAETARRAADAYVERLDPDERAALEAEALAAVSPETRQVYESAAMRRYAPALMRQMLREHLGPRFAPALTP
jgi:hypothetical protein